MRSVDAHESVARSDRRAMSSAVGLLLAILLAVPIYWPQLQGYFLSDDFELLYRATVEPVGSWVFVPDPSRYPWHRPLPDALWRVDYLRFGLEPAGYYLTNFAVHAATTAVLWSVTYTLTRSAAGAAVAAAFFAWHPLSAITASWLSARYDLVATLFILTAIRVGIASHRRQSALLLAGVACATWAAISSKEVAYGLPVLALALSAPSLARASGLSDPPFGRREAAVIVLVAVAMIAIRVSALGGLGGYGVHGSLRNVEWRNLFWWLPFLVQQWWGPADLPRLVWMLIAVALLVVWARLTPMWYAAYAALLLPAINIMNVGSIGPLPDFGRLLYAPLAVGACAIGHFVGSRRLSSWPNTVAALITVTLPAQSLYIVLTFAQASELARTVGQTLAAHARLLPPGSAVDCSLLPDNIRGAPVYRNGCDTQARLTLGDVRGIRVVPGIPQDVLTAARREFPVVLTLSRDGSALVASEEKRP
jgi:hypothetical protein